MSRPLTVGRAQGPPREEQREIDRHIGPHLASPKIFNRGGAPGTRPTPGVNADLQHKSPRGKQTLRSRPPIGGNQSMSKRRKKKGARTAAPLASEIVARGLQGGRRRPSAWSRSGDQVVRIL